MSLYIASLNSGSNGNCYYVGNDTDAVLVDAGLSCRETEKRMKRIDLPMGRLRAIFVSHEHHDHIRGLQLIAHRYKLPVYITPRTLQHTPADLFPELIRHFAHGDCITVGSLMVTAFAKHHDGIDPHSFVVSHKGINIGVFTDVGIVCDNLSRHFALCHAAFLESNYDEQMLETGRYPYHLKQRIRGGKGHISNRQALELFLQHRPAHMSHLLLSHLSKENNSPEIAYRTFSSHAGSTQIIVASRYEQSAVYHITGIPQPLGMPVHVPQAKPVQATLF